MITFFFADITTEINKFIKITSQRSCDVISCFRLPYPFGNLYFWADLVEIWFRGLILGVDSKSEAIFYITGGTFLLALALQHFFANPECCTVARGRICNKIVGTMLQNTHRIELFATFCRYWGYTCNRVRLLSQNRFEDVELPVRVENRRCSHGFRGRYQADICHFCNFASEKATGTP